MYQPPDQFPPIEGNPGSDTFGSVFAILLGACVFGGLIGYFFG